MLSISPILGDYHSLSCGRKDNHALLFEDNQAVGRPVMSYCLRTIKRSEGQSRLIV